MPPKNQGRRPRAPQGVTQATRHSADAPIDNQVKISSDIPAGAQAVERPLATSSNAQTSASTSKTGRRATQNKAGYQAAKRPASTSLDQQASARTSTPSKEKKKRKAASIGNTDARAAKRQKVNRPDAIRSDASGSDAQRQGSHHPVHTQSVVREDHTQPNQHVGVEAHDNNYEEQPALLDNLDHLTDWSSNVKNIEEKHIAVIRGIAVEGKTRGEVAQLLFDNGMTKKLGHENNVTNMWNRWGPRFYEEKGVRWLTGDERKEVNKNKKTAEKANAEKASVEKKEKRQARQPTKTVAVPAKSFGKSEVPWTKDMQENGLGSVFVPRILQYRSKNIADIQSKAKKLKKTEKVPSSEDVARFFANHLDPDVLAFYAVDDYNPHRAHPHRLVVRRESIMKYSTHIRKEIQDKPDIVTIQYEDLNTNTIQRFVSCISPTLRSTLPTHDIGIKMPKDQKDYDPNSREINSMQIHWTAQELTDLLQLSLVLGCVRVRDMVLDVWFERICQSTPTLVREAGYTGDEFEPFETLDFDPGFLNVIMGIDPKFAGFITDAIVAKGTAAFEKIMRGKRGDYTAQVLDVLMQKALCQDTLQNAAVTKSPDDCCKLYHYHGKHEQCYRKATLSPVTAVALLAEMEQSPDLHLRELSVIPPEPQSSGLMHNSPEEKAFFGDSDSSSESEAETEPEDHRAITVNHRSPGYRGQMEEEESEPEDYFFDADHGDETEKGGNGLKPTLPAWTSGGEEQMSEGDDEGGEDDGGGSHEMATAGEYGSHDTDEAMSGDSEITRTANTAGQWANDGSEDSEMEDFSDTDESSHELELGLEEEDGADELL